MLLGGRGQPIMENKVLVTASAFYAASPSERTKERLNELLDAARQEGARLALKRHKDFQAGCRFGIEAAASWCEKNLYVLQNDKTLRRKPDCLPVNSLLIADGIRTLKHNSLFREEDEKPSA